MIARAPDASFLIGCTFEPPRDFDPEKHFAKTFGAFVGKGDHRVVVRFAPEIAHRRIWHPSQEERPRTDGSVDVVLRLDTLDEVERWILGWGPQAQVLAPAELVKRVRDAAEQVCRIYRATH